MTDSDERQHRQILKKIAHRVMIERGLIPDYPTHVIDQLNGISGPAKGNEESVHDLRDLLWCSIDNDDSLDLDQLTVTEVNSDGSAKLFIAIADVDVIVKKQSAIDDYAKQNTTSVYTVAQIFAMLPEKLSTDITSLNYDSDRMAIVIEMVVSAEGLLLDSDIYRAFVHNKAKLAYNSVADWLEGKGPIPRMITSVIGLEENLRFQDSLAQKLKLLRHMNGALDLETIEVRPIFEGYKLKELEPETSNRAKNIIEDFMIAANGVTARYLESKQFPSFRRVVKTPKQWDRIIALAAEWGTTLPKNPDSKALGQFLVTAKTSDPLRFPDLSLSVIKLLGQGEYIAQFQGENVSGHFGLAVKDYSHSTAPNRRFPDLITQRLLKAALMGGISPYSNDELEELALQCTKQEDEAKKVERQVLKSAAAILLKPRIGDNFDAIVTGASEKGNWVRLMNPPVEGKLRGNFKGIEVGQKLTVKLISIDIERGYIDFKKADK